MRLRVSVIPMNRSGPASGHLGKYSVLIEP
jgi:hypothetical protein